MRASRLLRGRYAVVLLAFGVVAAFAMRVPAGSRAASLPNALVVDGQYGDPQTNGRFWSWQDPVDASIGLGDSPYRLGMRNGIEVFGQQVGWPQTGDQWRVSIALPPGQVLAPGTYSGDDYDPFDNNVYFNASVGSYTCTSSGTVTIDEITWTATNEPSAVSLHFVQTCAGATGSTYGEVRIGTAMDVNAAGTVPVPSALAFDPGETGVTSAAKSTTLTNTGDDPLVIGTPAISGPDSDSFGIVGGDCAGATLAPWAACSLNVAMTPQVKGALHAALVVPTSALAGGETIPLAGHGRLATTTTLAVSPGPVIWTGDPYVFSGTVTPNPGSGTVKLCRVGSSSCLSRTVDAATGGFSLTGPAGWGTFSYTAAFQGTADYLPSASGTATFVAGNPTTTTLWSSWNPARPDRLVLLVAQVDPVRAEDGRGYGTLTISSGDQVLKTSDVSPAAPWTWVCLRVPPGGMPLLGTYAPTSALFLPSSVAVDQLADPGAPNAAVPPLGMPSGYSLGTKPCSDLLVNGGAAATSSATVNLDFDFVNAGSIPPDEVAFSNDGVSWVGGSATRLRPWSLVDPAAGGTDADGAKTVWARWRAGAWWSDPVSATITLDRSAPTMSVPARTLPVAKALNGSRVATQISWTGSDGGSGVAAYRLDRRVDGGAWSVIATTASSSWTGYLAPSHSYQFRVTATNGAGGRTTSVGQAFDLRAVGESSATIIYAGTWRTASSPSFVGGASRYAKTAGAKATFTTSRRGFAWVAAVGPTRGSARVYVNGSLLKTVSLYASTAGYRRIVYSVTWSTAKARTIVIKVVGTAGHPRVDVDGIYSWD